MEKLKSRAETHSEWSTSGPSGGLPLVPCPKCHATMIWAVSGSSKNQGKEYYKCPRNDGVRIDLSLNFDVKPNLLFDVEVGLYVLVQPYSKECDTFMWKDQYKRLLSGMHPVEHERRDNHVFEQLAAIKTSLDQMNDQITKSIQKSSAADEKLKVIVVAFIFFLVGVYIGKVGN